MSSGIDLNDDELIAVSEVQRKVQQEFLGKEFDLRTQIEMTKKLEDGLASAGFEAKVQFVPTPQGYVIPQVTLTGRTDKKLESLLKAESDFERKVWDANKRSSKDLADMGANLDLLE